MATTYPPAFSGPPPAYGQAFNQDPVHDKPAPPDYQQAGPISSTTVKPQIKTYMISHESSSKKHLTLALESTGQRVFTIDGGSKMTLHPTLTMKSIASGLSITSQGAPLTSHIDMTSTGTKGFPAQKSEFYHKHSEGGGTHAFTHPVNGQLYFWKRTHDSTLTSRPGDGLRQNTACGHLKCVDAKTGEVVAVYVAKGWATSRHNYGRFDVYLSPGKDSEEWESWLLFAGVLLEEKIRDENNSAAIAVAAQS